VREALLIAFLVLLTIAGAVALAVALVDLTLLGPLRTVTLIVSEVPT